MRIYLEALPSWEAIPPEDSLESHRKENTERIGYEFGNTARTKLTTAC